MSANGESMSDTSAGVLRCRWLGTAVVGLAVTSACAPRSGARQTDIMAGTGKVSVSAAVLRVRINDLVDRSAGRIELAADRISADTADEALRRRALLLKVDAIPAVYSAGFRADPVASAVDVWGFAFQFRQFMEDGAGRNTFGPGQAVLQECARDLLADVDAVVRAIAIRPEHFDQARARVEGWAKSHPVDLAFSSRASGVALVAELRSAERDVFLAVGAVSDVIENLSERLNVYAAQLPKQARWQAEILIKEMAGSLGVEGALGDVRDVGVAARRATDVLGDVGAAARRANEVLGDLPGLLGAERDILAAERRAILTSINTQRSQTLEYLTAERFAVLAAAREERVALVAALRQERIEALLEVDAIKTRAIESGLAGFKDLIDYTLWRVAAGIIVLMLVAATLVVIVFWLVPARRRGGATSS
jgi:hypothetical protein